MKKLLSILIMFLLLISLVSALKIIRQDEIKIDKELDEGLFAAGGTIIIDENIGGDATVFGGSISINSAVTKSLMSCGGDITINGPVGTNAHVCGGNINVNSDVGSDLFAAGGNININGDVDGTVRTIGGNININSVKGDILALGGMVAIDGLVGGDVAVTAGEIRIDGIIDGDVYLEADKIRFGDDAYIVGNLNYTAAEVIIDEDQVGGEIYKTIKVPKKTNYYNKYVFKIFSTIILIIIGLIMVLSMPKLSTKLVDNIEYSFWKTFLFGFLALVAVPIAALLIAITLIGIPITIILLMLYVFAIFISPIFVSLLVGRYLLANQENQAWPLVLGIVIYGVVSIIPIIGGFVKFIAVLLGLGTIMVAIFNRHNQKNKVKRN